MKLERIHFTKPAVRMCASPNLQKFFNFLFSVDQVPVDYAKCEYDYLDHYGNDITGALSNIATKEECKCLKKLKFYTFCCLNSPSTRDACVNETSCVTAAYAPSLQKCWLKDGFQYPPAINMEVMSLNLGCGMTQMSLKMYLF